MLFLERPDGRKFSLIILTSLCVTIVSWQSLYEARVEHDFVSRFEMKNRIDMQQNLAAEHASSVFPISTAARKVLKEYGLRYGVCSLYRQIAALVCMAE